MLQQHSDYHRHAALLADSRTFRHSLGPPVDQVETECQNQKEHEDADERPELHKAHCPSFGVEKAMMSMIVRMSHICSSEVGRAGLEPANLPTYVV